MAWLKRWVPARWTLRQLLRLDSWLYQTTSRVAVWYGGGLHPKHRLTGYHDFFIRNIRGGDRVLDIGCGNGVMDHHIVRATGARVTGVDRDRSAIADARRRYADGRLTFVVGEAQDGVIDGPFDVVILSNVLEHLEGRVDFLRSIRERIRPDRVLIRVPLFERDWRVPLKGELGVNYLLDPTHSAEHTREGWFEEIRRADFAVREFEVRWGELWAVCVLAESRP
jgi:2-polyprenyl-3-methyl-5-hydroxy-6-metoxy-1,4-benzoquinol methylase